MLKPKKKMFLSSKTTYIKPKTVSKRAIGAVKKVAPMKKKPMTKFKKPSNGIGVGY